LQDLANVEAGMYPLPADHDGSLLTLIHRSRLFFADLPAIHRRREHHATNEVLSEAPRGERPRYYLQNFHFQSGGWIPTIPLSAATPRSRCCLMVQPMLCADRLCRRSTKHLQVAISVN
jgi:hypothetical protein